ncbi:hypothetical protein Ppa06_62520 [Planomonospora parontospora subsp. parontospora]|uniref:Secreted protein n=2 Tax=Planomonospora parontospora TaxID=58119 RepID=A0AA37BCD8_9ACTN|nr:hypothetical protein [Planomonospora parontospora]GGK49323.1 hypothetical protein GCM10010126_06160 [Planomonospora parontospora]GII12454.1 hypothetical protein Ppa06_62520 [Planomonospora parontospora subsp. parontospora]
MSADTLVWVAAVVVAVVAIVAVGYAVLRQRRRHRLRDRFGPEYDRTVRERENRREAEQELLAREQRFDSLDIRPLSPEARQAYAKKWTEVQERFVDAPGFSVTEADQLVTSVMADRGYPTEDFEQRIADLSVAHGRTLDHYRKAHEISGRAVRQAASTEELRQAMVHYRALFEELLEAPGSRGADDGSPRNAPRSGSPRNGSLGERPERPSHDRSPRHAEAGSGQAREDTRTD